MKTESLHLAASFVDQYTWRRSITEMSYQLVGITALFIAGKVHERISASLRVLCYLTEHSYNQNEVCYSSKQRRNAMYSHSAVWSELHPQHFLSKQEDRNPWTDGQSQLGGWSANLDHYL